MVSASWFIWDFIFSFFQLKARSLLLLSIVTKVSKSTLCLRGPKEVIITAEVLYYLFFSTISARLCSYLRSVLIGDYNISTLCFWGDFLPYLCLKDSTYKTSPLVSAFTKRPQSSATLRCHNSLPAHYPTVVDRCYVLFSWFLRGWSDVDDEDGSQWWLRLRVSTKCSPRTQSVLVPNEIRQRSRLSPFHLNSP